MNMKKTLLALFVGGFCSFSLMAAENVSDNKEEIALGATQISSICESIPDEICAEIFKDIDLLSVIQFKGVSKASQCFVEQCFRFLNHDQIPNHILTTDKINVVMKYLNGLSSLRVLNLEGSYQITPVGLGYLNLTNLQHLNVNNCGGLMSCEGNGFPYERLTNLISLNMWGMEKNMVNGQENMDDELVRLAICTNLTSLNVGRWTITETGLGNLLTAVPSIRELWLDRNYEMVTDTWLLSFDFSHLTVLDMVDTSEVTLEVVEQTRMKYPNLKLTWKESQ